LYAGKLLEEAEKKIKGPDVIVDPLDYTYCWVSARHAKLLGYTAREMVDEQVFHFTALPVTAEAKNKLMLTMAKPSGVTQIPLKTKGGKRMLVKFRHAVFEFEGSPYMAAKAIK